MQKIHETITINAPKEKVWDVMLGEESYRQWTTAFGGGSRFIGDWSLGSKMLFLGPTEDGSEMGMVGMVRDNRPYEHISIEHIGIIKDGVEDTTSEEARKWAPAFENYTFTDTPEGTEISIDQDIGEEYKEEFHSMWDSALNALKALAEK